MKKKQPPKKKADKKPKPVKKPSDKKKRENEDFYGQDWGDERGWDHDPPRPDFGEHDTYNTRY